MKLPRIGRPLKYKHFIEALDDNTIYTPATIVLVGLMKGFFNANSQEQELKNAKLRVRHTLARFSYNHCFPFDGDGFVYLAGQPPLRGWRGSRWKQAADVEPVRLKRQA